ncbi:DUF4176 domain-containing protein [Clostridium sp. HBUAS56017]|uniref:DUF4176 domain-containing protein n=1 Tax=Clostridium sp. HBUAS56017 TaxID=2571128 RepID=UPI00163DB962|nr:DUF4176 domain-containing protein [Clostridium sp. HBUAS56017]
MLNVNKKELTEKLLAEWLQTLEYLDNNKRKQLYEIGCAYSGRDISFLYEINRTICEKENTCRDNINDLVYINEKDKHLLIFKESKMEFTYAQMREVLFGLIDIVEKIYPLGTAVELKKEYLEKIIGKKDIKSAQVIIVNRFIFHNDVKSFFHYAGIVYPLGFLDESRVINFTSALVDKVLKKGYSDEKEDAYVYLMKKELIIDKKMHSFGFSTEEERENFEKKLEVEGA